MAHAKTVNIIKPTDYERFNNLYAFSHTGTGRRGRCVKMHTFIILRTKPRLSQAGALLLPKDSVSLGIRISL